MILHVILLFSSLVFTSVDSQGSNCVETCPISNESDDFQLSLTPGRSTVFCVDYQYYKLEDEQNVALFNLSRSFCSIAEKFLDPLASVLNIKCSITSVSINGSLCKYSAVALGCELPDDDDDLLFNESSALSMLNSGKDLGLALQLTSTNVAMTGFKKCNLFLNVSWNMIGKYHMFQHKLHITCNYFCVECNVEETHSAVTDMCSGIGSVVFAVGTNTSWFVVENLAVDDVNTNAFLISASSPVCKSRLNDYDVHDNTQLICDVVSGNLTVMQSLGVNITLLNVSANFLAFK